MSDEVFLVPRSEVSWGDIKEALGALGATEREPEQGFHLSWALGDTVVRFFEDQGLRIEQLMVDGPDQDAVAERLRERIPTYAPDDMPALFAETDDEDEGELEVLLAILASVAPRQADPALVELFGRGFRNEEPLVREQAVIAASLPAWPELRGEIERLARDDEDEDVRDTAAAILGSYGQRR